MSTNIRKILTIIAVMSAVSVSGQYRANFVLPTISANAQEIPTQEARTQQFMREDINRRRNNTRAVPELKRGEPTERMQNIPELQRGNPADRFQNVPEAKRGELTERVQSALDARREQRVMQISQKLNDLNARVTNRHLRTIERIESILQRVTTRAERALQRGANMEEVNAKIREAERLIIEARRLITIQSQVSYQVLTTDNETAAEVAQRAREGLRAGTENIQQATRRARHAVLEIIRALDAGWGNN